MEQYNLFFLQEALDDLEEIVLYIAQDSGSAALSMYDVIISKAEELKTFPKRGRPVPDAKMQKSGFRMLLIKPYIAFYRCMGETVFIYRVLHGATNYPLLYEKISNQTPSLD